MENLAKFDQDHIWHPFTQVGSHQPVVLKGAKGIYLHTDDGRKIIDAISSWWVNIHGHSNEVIAAALAKQAAELEHVIFAGFTHEPAIQLTKNLLSVLPPSQQKVFFSDNGSTAVEVAVKMALQFWYNQGTPRRKIIAIRGAYHGDTFGAMSVAERNIFSRPFNELLFETHFIDFPNSQNETEVINAFHALIDQHDVAAFIFEPIIQGAAGMRMYSPAVLDQLISSAQKAGVICIADEVFTGFYRTGKFFASDFLSNKPDIFCLSKGITGGALPLGVTTCTNRIFSAFHSDDIYKTFFHGHSFTANPLACAAANASFELLTAEVCVEQINRITAHQRSFVESMRSHPSLQDARSMGTIAAIELASGEKTSYANSLRKKIYSWFMNEGILLRPLGNVIYTVPAYITTEEELSFIHNKIREFLEKN